MEQEDIALKKIVEYYGTETTRIWNILTQGHIHLGYWDDNNRDASFADGTKRLTQLMIDNTEIGQGQRFCDIGCGVGVPAIMLARAKNCLVDGVTLSEHQKEDAEKRAGIEGVTDKIRFFTANALNMPFADNTYDGGWFFESIFHMGHHNALCEAHRVLKPGAVLLIADVVDIGLLTEEDRKMAKDLCNAVYVTPDQYPDLLKGAGFEPLDIRDVTEEVMGLFDSKFVEAVRTNKDKLLNIMNEEALTAFETLGGEMKRSSGYLIVRAKNPG